MNITKAILLTILYYAISMVIAAGFYFLIVPFQDDKVHYFQYFAISEIAITLLSYFIMFFFVYKIKFNVNRGIEKIKNIDWSILLILLVIIVGFKLIINPFVSFKSIIDSLRHIEMHLPQQPKLEYHNPWIYGFISIVILAPILEELLFRKLLFNELLKKNSLMISALVSSFCFVLIHIPNWANLVPCFIFGLLCCLIYFRTKNILYTILFHSADNLYEFILSIYGKPYKDWLNGLHFNLLYWFLFIVGIGIVWFGIKRIETVDKRERIIQDEI